MRRSPTIELCRTQWLALALLPALTGCPRAGGGAPGPAPVTTSNVPSPPASAPAERAREAVDPAPPPAVDAPPAGWSRLELASVTPELTGTIDVPPGLAVVTNPAEENDRDGLTVVTRGVYIGPRPGGLELTTMAVIPPRFESAAAMAKFHGQFELVSTHELGPGHWAVVQRWRPGQCMLHGWSAPAGLVCDVFQAPCDQMEQWVQVCSTLRPGPTPNTSETTPQSAFPQLEPAAATVAMTVARAVARNDAAMLLGAIGPAGLKLGKKKHTAQSLEAALAGKTVLQVVAPIFYRPGESAEDMLIWSSSAPHEDEVRVWFSTGYGEQPYFELKKTGDAWHLVRFGVHDLGDP